MKNKIPFINPLPEINLAIDAVIDAGKTIMEIYDQGFEQTTKTNNEPPIKIAEKLIETKIKSNYPEKFRTCWGKNTSEQIFKIANMLHVHDLEKGITLARQTNSKEALKSVKRDNIKLESYANLEKKFNSLKAINQTISELI